MIDPWYIVKCVVAAVIIVFCLFLLESFISAKINEIKNRKREKQYLNQMLDKLADEIWEDIKREKEGNEDDIKSE